MDRLRDLRFWSDLSQLASLVTLLAMCISLIIGGSATRYPLTLYLAGTSAVLAVLAVLLFAIHVIRYRRSEAS